MGKISDATFKGRTGEYSFQVYPADTEFNDLGAVYIFTTRRVDANGKGSHFLLYIGQAESLKERIPGHEKWPCTREYGVNCICVHRDDNEQSRIEKETDLRAGNATPCNDQ